MGDVIKYNKSKTKPTVKPLSKELKDKVRSGCTIVSVAQCVAELVYNAVDAGAKKIYVGVNLSAFNVEVGDDGHGLSRADLEVIGKRYATSKISCQEDLKNPHFYGYRGEALASIINVSHAVKFLTRSESGPAYRRWYRNGKPSDSGIEELPASKKPRGLTVTVEGLFERQPVRQRNLDRSIQFEEIKVVLEYIALANLNISIELRNEKSMAVLLKYNSCLSHTEAFDQLYCVKRKGDFHFVSESHLQDGLLFTAQVGRKMFRLKCFQFVFVNKRCLEYRGKFHKAMNDGLMKILSGPAASTSEDKIRIKGDKLYPVFILNVTCSMEKYCPTGDQKYNVEFSNWQPCLKGIEGLILKYQMAIDPAGIDIYEKKSTIKPHCKAVRTGRVKDSNESPHSIEQSFGRNVSTYDVKGAIHSKEVVRESLQNKLRDQDNAPSYTADMNSQESEQSSRDKHQKVEDDMSVSYTDLEDSPSQRHAVVGRRESEKEKRPERSRSSAKHTVYNVRRSQKQQRKISVKNGRPRKDIIVPKRKPKPNHHVLNLTKNVFNKFPEWGKTRDERHDEPQSTSSYSPPANKKPRYGDLKYKPKEKFPSSKGRTFAFPNFSSQNVPRYLPSTQKPMLPPDEKNHHLDISWKMNRFLSALKSKDQSVIDDDESSIQARRPFTTSQDSIMSVDSASKANLKYQEKCNSDNNAAIVSSVGLKNTENVTEDLVNVMIQEAQEFVVAKGLDNFDKQISSALQKDYQTRKIGKLRDQNAKKCNPVESPVSKPCNLFDDSALLLSADIVSSLVAQDGLKKAKKATTFLVSETPDPFGINQVMKMNYKPIQNQQKSSNNNQLKRPSILPLEVRVPSLDFIGSAESSGQNHVDKIVDEEISPYFFSIEEPIYSNTSENHGIRDRKNTSKEMSFDVHPQTLRRSETFSESEYFANKISPSPYVTEHNNNLHSSQILCERDSPSLQDAPDISQLFLVEDEEEDNGEKHDNMQNMEEEDEDDNWGNWEVVVVYDATGQEWLQYLDEDGKTVFINLSTGDFSHDMINIVQKSRTTAANLATNYRSRNWLRRYFPKGCDKLWKPGELGKPLLVNGNIQASTNHLGEKVKELIVKSWVDSTDIHEKWREDALTTAMMPDSEQTSEYWAEPNDVSEMLVTGLAGPPSVKAWNKVMSRPMKFSKEDLHNVTVISQWDKKFIIAKTTVEQVVENTETKVAKELLVIFDQHAVDERIRLERFLDEAVVEDKNLQTKRVISERIIPPWTLTLNETEVRIVDRYQDMLKLIGVTVEVVDETDIKIHSAPLCIMDKVASEPQIHRKRLLSEMLTSLIQEEVQKILETRGGVSVTSIPKTLFNILCSKACHGAIKFGDELDPSDCETMISSLKNCKTPFQCAHGRPSLVPVMDLSSVLQRLPLSNPYNTPNPHWTQQPGEAFNDLQSESKSLYFNTSSDKM